MALKEIEWKTINNILLELYTVDDLYLLSEKFLKLIGMLIPFSKGYFVLLDDDGKIIRDKSYFTGFEEKEEKEYIEKYFDEDYLHYLLDMSFETTVFQDTDILDNDVRKSTLFYRKFLKPSAISYGSGIIIIRNSRVTGVFNLFRTEAMGDFSEKDIYILNLLKRHMENMVYKVTQSYRANFSIEKAINNFGEEYCLTDREKEVLMLINKGFSNQEISDKLVISLSTVKKHVFNIFNKVGVSSRGQLLSLFLEH